MPPQLEQWRDTLYPHRYLLRDLLLISFCCLICLLYFNEQWLNNSSEQRQQSLDGLATQLAQYSYVPLAANNRVSLNVLAQELAAQPSVTGVRIETLSRDAVTRTGEPGAVKAVAVVGGQQRDVIGRVVVFGKAAETPALWPFFLLWLCLLGVRAAMTFLWEQLLPFSSRTWQNLRDKTRILRNTAPSPETTPLQLPRHEARLDVGIVDYGRLEQCCTEEALRQLVADYDAVLQRIARLYGARVERALGPRAVLVLPHAQADEAVFMLTCCARLVQNCIKQLNQTREEKGQSCLQLRLLLSQQAPEALRETSQYKVAAGHLCLLLPALSPVLQQRLSAQLLEQWQDDNAPWQLLAGIQLAERYQQLITSQQQRLAQEAEPGANQADATA